MTQEEMDMMEQTQTETPETGSEMAQEETMQEGATNEGMSEEQKPSVSIAILDNLNKRRGTNYTELNEEALADLQDEFNMGNEVIDKLLAVFEENPEVKVFLSALMANKSIRYAFNKSFDPEMLKSMEGDEDEEDLKKLHEERALSQKEYDDLMAEMEANQTGSVQSIEKFITDNNIDEEKAMQFLGMVDQALVDVARGKLTEELLSKLWKGFIHEEVVAETEATAKEEGLIEGKNAVIEKKMTKGANMGTGLPELQATRTATVKAPIKGEGGFGKYKSDDSFELRGRNKK